MTGSKSFVYVLRSVRDRSRYYTGLTSDISSRLAAHNAGRCQHTATGRPWEVDLVVEFAEEARAVTSGETHVGPIPGRRDIVEGCDGGARGE